MKRRNIFASLLALFAVKAKGMQPTLPLIPEQDWKARLFDAILALEGENISVEFNPQTGHSQAIYPKGIMFTKHLWAGHRFWKESVFITEREPKAILEVIPAAVKVITEKAEQMKVWYAENPWAVEDDLKSMGYFVLPPDYEKVLQASIKP